LETELVMQSALNANTSGMVEIVGMRMRRIFLASRPILATSGAIIHATTKNTTSTVEIALTLSNSYIDVSVTHSHIA